MKNDGNSSRGHSQGVPKMFKDGAWAYPGTTHFWIPPIISGTGKLWTSSFVGTFILRSIGAHEK